jgi:hypothetical protein
MNKVLFKEEQQFWQQWYILLLGSTAPVLFIFFYILIQQGFRGIPVGEKPMPTEMAVVFFLGTIILLWFCFITKLEVWIDQEGIHYKYLPLLFKDRIIRKEEIQEYKIRKYDPIMEYGGWGVRRSFRRKSGKAINMSGNIGLQLYLKNGKKVLFGTLRQQAIMYAMNEMMKGKHL